MPKYPVIAAPRLDPCDDNWVVVIERAPGDAIKKRFPNRADARSAAKGWRAAARILLPSKGAVVAEGAEPLKLTSPRTKKDLLDLISRTIAQSQANELPITSVQPIVQLAKLQMKLLDMKDPEDDLTDLTEEELLDRIFAQLTTEELLELARQRLDLRRAELAA